MYKQAGFIGNKSESVADSSGEKKLTTAGSERDFENDTVGEITAPDPVLSVRTCDVFYGDVHAIRDVSLDIGRNEVVAMIGPSDLNDPNAGRLLVVSPPEGGRSQLRHQTRGLPTLRPRRFYPDPTDPERGSPRREDAKCAQPLRDRKGVSQRMLPLPLLHML